MTGRLIAVEAVGSEWFVDQVEAAWESGDAILPVDPRLPAAAREALIERMRPAVLRHEDGAETPLPEPEPVADGDALVIATSGSSGEPKGVVHTHDSLMASAVITSRHIGVDPSVDRWLACLPLAHIGGFAVVSRALLTDTPLTVAPRPSASAIADALDAGATRTALVPAALDGIDTAGYKTVLLGGSRIPEERPANTVVTYGSTETGSGIVYDGEVLDGVEVQAVAGELRVRSPTLGRCYRDGTAIVDDDGWFGTGDVGDVGTNGMVRVYGRAADVITTGGEKVWPAAVEARLAEHPSVSEVAVVGRPDPRWGERVEAVVVAGASVAAPSLAELRAWVKEALPAHCAPRAVEGVESLPRLPGGKVDRRRL